MKEKKPNTLQIIKHQYNLDYMITKGLKIILRAPIEDGLYKISLPELMEKTKYDYSKVYFIVYELIRKKIIKTIKGTIKDGRRDAELLIKLLFTESNS